MGTAMQRIIGTGPHRQFRRIVAAKNNSPSAAEIRDDGRIFLGNRVGQIRQTVAGSAACQIDVDLDRNRQAMQRPLPFAGCRALVQLSRTGAAIIAANSYGPEGALKLRGESAIIDGTTLLAAAPPTGDGVLRAQLLERAIS